MYEYEVVPVRTVRALEEDFDKDKVENVGAIPLEDAIKLALTFLRQTAGSCTPATSERAPSWSLSG